jgi:release factor glutamine methyltransferase
MVESMASLSVGDAKREAARRLRSRGIETPDLDARLLIAHAVGVDQAGLVHASHRLLTAVESARIEVLLARRLAHEPVARIIGVKEFWSLPLAVSSAVLVPRPETETLVEAALRALDRHGECGKVRHIADLGTGSGAIMLALLSELPKAFAVGTDRDAKALEIARANAVQLNLAHRTAFVCCDFGTALAGGFDLVVTNPPYVRTGDISRLDPEVHAFDPRAALDGGADGLAAYRLIAADAPRLLAPNGYLLAEIGVGQADAVRSLFAQLGPITIDPDLAGIARVVSAGPRRMIAAQS